MSISKEKILQDKYATNVIQSLSDNPNESGLDAENLKIAFDAGATHIKNYIHDDLIDDINSEIATLSTNTNTTIGQLDNLTTTNKSNIVSASNEINAKLEDTGWKTITPTNGTAATDINYIPKYRKIGKLVTMRGYITVKNNNAMFTLPEAYRPSARLTFSGTNDNRNVNEIRVTEGGDVRLLDTTGSLSSGVSCFLDNITYFID
jgi:hypothetical protein